MRAAALSVVLLAGCLDPEILPPGVSCEVQGWIRQSAPGRDVDLVIVVSDAPSMAPYRERLLANLAAFGPTLDAAGASLHIALVDAGGLTIGEGCAPDTTVPFLSDVRQPWWACADDDATCRLRNYEGELGEILACAAPAENIVSAPSLIQEVTNAITGDDTGFIRPDADLGIIVISAVDDASAQPVAVYLDRIRSSRTDPSRIWVGTINGPGATRLAALRAPFAQSITYPIDDEDWTGVLAPAFYKTTLAAACLEPGVVTDLDDEAPGIQPDCYPIDHAGQPLPACRMATPDRPDPDVLPCFWVQVHDWGCSEAIVERLRWDDDGEGTLRCACDL